MQDIFKSYQFNIVENSQLLNHPLIHSIGWETRYKENNYLWDCKLNNESVCVFQYTVAGEGIIEINNKVYRQSPGSVFMIERPGPYKYYISEYNDLWELKFFTFTMSSMPFWNAITNSFGRIIHLPENCEVMQLWGNIFDKTVNGKIDNLFDNSLLAYTFLMTLHKYLRENGTMSDGSESIELCIEFINSNYYKEISLADIANAGKISPFYLNKRFKEIIGDTPLHYLIKQRVKNSMNMLYNTELTINEIAIKCGFENANYFAKVFRKYTNLSPTDFRNQKIPPVII